MRRRSEFAVIALLSLGGLVWFWPGDAAAPESPDEAKASAPARSQRSPGATWRSASGTALPHADLERSPSGRPCLEGRVLDAVTGGAIAGAQAVFAASSGALTARAGPDGRFRIEATEGAVTLAELSADGFFPFRPDWGHSPVELTLTRGVCVSELVLTLTPRLVYRGRVVSPEGASVGGATVTISTDAEAPGAPIASAPDGSFTFSAREGALLVARHPRFAPATAEVDFRVRLTKELTLRLGPRPLDAGVERTLLRGLVVDGRDGSVAGARVEVRRDVEVERSVWLRLEAATETDPDGRFEAEADGPGPWTLVASVSGAVSPSTTTEGAPVVLRLADGSTLKGSVTDLEGRPVTSFSVLARQRLGAIRLGEELIRHFVDAKGRFTMRGNPSGRLEVVAAAWGYAPSNPVEVHLEPEATRHLDFKLSRGATITGRVVDRTTRAPLPEAQVSLELAHDDALAVTPSALSGEDGRFTLSGVRPGHGSLFVVADGHHARLWSVVVPEGDPTVGSITIELKALTLKETPQLELVGLGAVLAPADDGLELQGVIASGGAAAAGLQPHDVILAIDGTPVETLGFEGAIQRIRGPEGTTVRLSVRRADGTTFTVDAPRRLIETR